MLKINYLNLTKKDISKKVSQKTGLSMQYCEEIINDLLIILKNIIKSDKLNIKNFGSFKLRNKPERIGRNPKNKIESIISARKSISFIKSKNFKLKNLD